MDTTTGTAIANLIIEAVDDRELTITDLNALGKLISESKLRLSVGAFRAGMRVRIIACRPKYLHGTEAEILKINQKTATVKLGPIAGRATVATRFYEGQQIRCPLEFLEPVGKVA